MTPYNFMIDDATVEAISAAAEQQNITFSAIIGQALALCVKAQEVKGRPAIIDQDGATHYVQFTDLESPPS